MKISVVSGDMVVKVAITVAAGLVLWYMVNRAANAASSAADSSVHPFKGFDAWMQEKWDALTGATPSTPALPVNFGVIDPNAPW